MSQESYRRDAGRWMSQAKSDVVAAKASRNAGSCEWACFQAQQAGGKALKALWYQRMHDPWGHSLVRLITDFPEAALAGPLASLLPAAKSLDKLYVPTRYPNGLPDLTPADVFTAEDADAAISTAEALINAVEIPLGSATV